MITAIGWIIIVIAVIIAVIVTIAYFRARAAFEASKSIHKFVVEGKKQLEEERKRWEE